MAIKPAPPPGSTTCVYGLIDTNCSLRDSDEKSERTSTLKLVFIRRNEARISEALREAVSSIKRKLPVLATIRIRDAVCVLKKKWSTRILKKGQESAELFLKMKIVGVAANA